MNPILAVEQLLRTRILVAAIGEKLPTPWWRTEFLSTTGLSYCQRIFPRSFSQAAVTSVTVAACRDHNEKTGLRSFHLFRFPAYIERQLADMASQLNELAISDNPTTLLEELAAIQSTTKVPSASGPKSLGSIEVLKTRSTPSMLAGLYLDAAKTGKRVYPYFEAVGDE